MNNPTPPIDALSAVTSGLDFVLSFEDDFVLWMLTTWKDSLPKDRQPSVLYVIRLLESSDFLDDLLPMDPETELILSAWSFLNAPSTTTRIREDTDLATFVPYGILRIRDKMNYLMGSPV